MSATDRTAGLSGRRSARHALLLSSALAGAVLAGSPAQAQTLPNMPSDGATAAGGATSALSGPGNNTLNIDLHAQDRIIDFPSYSISADRTVNYLSSDPAGGKILTAVNRVVGNQASSILGHITTDLSNNVGAINVWLVNPNGITFGGGATYSGGSLVLSTLDIDGLANNNSNAMRDGGADPFFTNPAPLTFKAAGGPRLLEIQSGGGALSITGSLVLVGESITTGKALTATDQVVLLAGSQVTFSSGVGSPLSFSIDAGTTTNATGILVQSSLTGKNVLLAGGLKNALTGALLNVANGATLTATDNNGTVSLMTTGASITNAVGETPNISAAGSLIASGTNGDVIIDAAGNADVSNTVTAKRNVSLTAGAIATVSADVTAGGNYLVKADTVSLTGGTQQAKGTVNVETTGAATDISGSGSLILRSDSDDTGAEALTLKTLHSLNFAGTTSLQGGTSRTAKVDLTFDNSVDLQLGAIAAQTIYSNTAAGTLTNAASITAGGTISSVDSLEIKTTAGDISLAGATVTGTGNTLKVTTTAATGDITATGLLNGDGGVTVNSFHDASLTGLSGAGVSVTAGNDATVAGAVTSTADYTVNAKAITLGKAATTLLQQASGTVGITASAGNITGLGTVTLLSDSAGAGGNDLTLEASGTLALGAGSQLNAGPARQSDVYLTYDATLDLTLGGIAARTIYSKDITAAAFDTGAITNNAGITAGGTISSIDALEIKATAGDISLAGATVTGTGNTLKVTTTGITGDITATGLLNGAGALTVDAKRDASLAALSGAGVTVTAARDATVAGNVTSTADYMVTAQKVTLGTAGTRTQKATGIVAVQATAGDVTGLGALTLQSDSDGTGLETLTVNASNALNFAAASSLQGGPARQSAVSLLFDPTKAQVVGGISALEINSNANAGGLVSSDAALTFGGQVTSTNALTMTTTAGTLALAGAQVTGSGNALVLTTTTPTGLDVTSTAALSADGGVTVLAQRAINIDDATSTNGYVDLTALTGSLTAGDLNAKLYVFGNAATAAMTGGLTSGTSSAITGTQVSVGAASVGTDLFLTATNGSVTSAGGNVGNDVTISALAAIPANGTFTLTGPLLFGTAATGTGNLDITTSGDLTVTSLTTTKGKIWLTSTAGDILGAAAALTASTEIKVDAGRDAIIGSGDAQNGSMTLLAGRDASANSLSATTDVIVNATGTALVSGAVTAGTDYTVQGTSVTVGKAATTVLQKAKGFVTLTSTVLDVTGLGTLTVQSNSDAVGTEALTVTAFRAAQFGTGTLLEGGPARQSAVQLNFDTTAAQAFGGISASAITSNANIGGLVSNAASLTFGGKVTSTGALTITTSSGSLALAGAETTGPGASLGLLATAVGGLDVTSSAALKADGDLTVSAQRTVSIGDAASTNGFVDLTAVTGSLTAGALNANSYIYGYAATAAQTGGLTSGAYSVVQGTSVDVGAADVGSVLFLLASNGSVTSAGGTAGGGITISATHTTPANGSVAINAALTAGTSVPGTLQVIASGDVASAALTNQSGAVVVTSSTGSIGGTTLGSSLGVTASTDATVNAAVDAFVGTGTATTGTFSLTAGRDVTATALTAGTALSVGADVIVDAGRDATLGTLIGADDVDVRVTGAASLVSASTGTGTDSLLEPLALAGRVIRLRVGSLGGLVATSGLVVEDLTAGSILLQAGNGVVGTDIRIGKASATAGNLTVNSTTGSVTGLASTFVAPTGGPDLTTTGAVVISTGTSVVLGKVTAGSVTSSSIGSLQITEIAATSADLTADTNLYVGRSTLSGAATLRTLVGTNAASTTTGVLAPGFGAADLSATAAGGVIDVRAANGALQLGALSAGIGASTLAGNQIFGDAKALSVVSANAANGAISFNASGGDATVGIAGTPTALAAARSSLTIGATGDAFLSDGTATTGTLSVTGGGAATVGSGNAGSTLTVTAGGKATVGSGIAGGTVFVTAGTDADVTYGESTGSGLGIFAGGNATVGTVLASFNLGITAAGTVGVTSATSTTGFVAIAATGNVTAGSLTAGTDLSVRTNGDANLTTLTAGDDIDLWADGAITLGTATTTGLGADNAFTTLDMTKVGTINAFGLSPEIPGLAGSNIRIKAASLDPALTGGAATGLIVGAGSAGSWSASAATGDIQLGSLTATSGNIGVTAAQGSVTGLAAGYVPLAGGATLITPGSVIVDVSGAAALGSVNAGAFVTPGTVATLRIRTLTAGSVNASANTALEIGSATVTGSASLSTSGGTAGAFNTSGTLVPGFDPAMLNAQAANALITVSALNGAAQLGTVSAGTGTGTLGADQLSVTAQALTLASGTAANGAMVLRATTGAATLGTGAAGTNLIVNAKTDAAVTTGTANTGSLVVLAGGNVTAGTLAAGRDVAVRSGGDATLTTLTAGDDIDLQVPGTITLGSAAASGAAGTDDSFVALDPALAGATAGVVFGAEDSALTGSNIRIRAATLNPALTGGGGTGLIVSSGTAGSWAANAATGDIRLGSLTASSGDLALTATLGSVTGLASGYTPLAGGTSLSAPGKVLLGISGSAGLGAISAGSLTTLAPVAALRVRSLTAGTVNLTAANTIEIGTANISGSATLTTTGGTAAANDTTGFGGAKLAATAGNIAVTAAKAISVDTADAAAAAGTIALTSASIDLKTRVKAGSTVTLTSSGAGTTFVAAAGSPDEKANYVLTQAEMNTIDAPTAVVNSQANAVEFGTYAIGGNTGRTALRFLGTGAIALKGQISGTGTGALQIGGTTGAAPDPLNPVNPATLAASINGYAENGKVIVFDQGLVDLRARRITFGSNSLIAGYASAADAAVALDVANPGSLLYIGAGVAPGLVYLSAKTLQVSYSNFALFQNTLPGQGGGVELNKALTPQPSSKALALFSSGETGGNSFALFGTINGFIGRAAGILPNGSLEIFTINGNTRVIRVQQANSRVNGCVIGSPDKGCLIVDPPRPNLNLYDERQLQLFSTSDDDSALINPLVGRGNEGLIVGVADAPVSVGALDCNPTDPTCRETEGAK